MLIMRDWKKARLVNNAHWLTSVAGVAIRRNKYQDGWIKAYRRRVLLDYTSNLWFVPDLPFTFQIGSGVGRYSACGLQMGSDWGMGRTLSIQTTPRFSLVDGGTVTKDIVPIDSGFCEVLRILRVEEHKCRKKTAISVMKCTHASHGRFSRFLMRSCRWIRVKAEIGLIRSSRVNTRGTLISPSTP